MTTAESNRIEKCAAQIVGSLRKRAENPIFPIETVMRTHAGYALRQAEIFIQQAQAKGRPDIEQCGTAILTSMYAKQDLSGKPTEDDMSSRAAYALRQAEILVEVAAGKGEEGLVPTTTEILAGIYQRGESSATPAEPDMRTCAAHALRQAEILHELTEAW